MLAKLMFSSHTGVCSAQRPTLTWRSPFVIGLKDRPGQHIIESASAQAHEAGFKHAVLADGEGAVRRILEMYPRMGSSMVIVRYSQVVKPCSFIKPLWPKLPRWRVAISVGGRGSMQEQA